MGIHDREYYRSSPTTARQFVEWTRTAVGLLIAINVLIFIAQLLWPGDRLTLGLAAQASEVFSGHIWKLITANFAHSTSTPWHLFGNMMFLWVLGRELEQIYGRLDFFILYLTAGVLAMLAECLWNYVSAGGMQASIPVLGASGAVMAVVVLCTLFYPHKTVSMWFFPPVPLWLLCLLYTALDLFGVIQGETRIANVAHLAGGLVGLLYRVFDLRLKRLRFSGRFGFSPGAWLDSWRQASRSGGSSRRAGARPETEKIISMPRPQRAAQKPPRDDTSHDDPLHDRDPVYLRVDELLEKISASGMESLTGEELEFLKSNSTRFRRDREP